MANSNTTIEYISADLHNAAAEGKLDPFKVYQGHLDSLLTPYKNTILHVYLNTPSERSPEFIKEVVGIPSGPSLLSKGNDYGDTPLHIAARYGHAKAAKELIDQAKASLRNKNDIESGEEPREREMVEVRNMLSMTNENKETALHEAARNKKSLGVVEEILSYEARDEFTYSANDYGETPLYLAAKNGCEKIVSELLRNLKSLDYDGPNGRTALHAAAMHNHIEITDELLKKQSNLAKATDEKGWTPLHYAAYRGYTSVVQRLLEKDKSTAYIADKYQKRTALHIATCRGFQDIMEEIISKFPGCCELIDIKGWNVLHYAVISKSSEVLKAAIQHSSLIYLLNGKDIKGNTPVHLYKAYHPRLSSFIRKGDTDMFTYWTELHNQIPAGYISSKKNEILEWMKDLGTGPLGEIQNEQGTESLREIQNEKGNEPLGEVQNEKGTEPSKEIKNEKGTTPLGKIQSEKATGPYEEIQNGKEEDRREKNMIGRFEEAKDSHLVAAALIATVSFAAVFTIPSGYISDEKNLMKGTPILSKSPAFTAFIISDTIAMILSTCSVFIHFMLVILGYVEIYYWLIRCAMSCLFYAMIAMVITFVTGTCAVLATSIGFGISVIGLGFFLFLFYSIIRVTINLFEDDDDDDDGGDDGDIFTKQQKQKLITF